MAQKPETAIVNKIIRWVTEQGGNILKLHGSAMQRSGEPDLVGWVKVYGKAVHFAVEVKLPGEAPRKLQDYRLSEWARGEFEAGFVTSLEEFKKLVGFTDD